MKLFLSKLFGTHKKAKSSPHVRLSEHSALVDAATRVVIAVSNHPAAIRFLNESMMDTYHMLNVTRPNYKYGLPFSSREESLAHWTWNDRSRHFEPTKAEVLTERLDAQSRLGIRKLRAVKKIMRRISLARSRTAFGIDLQASVYLAKKIQAQAFKDAQYDEARILSFPYVLQYAEFANISFRAAADDILLKAKLYDDFLAKTELLRLSYFKQLKEISNADDIPNLLEAFHREAFGNAMV